LDFGDVSVFLTAGLLATVFGIDEDDDWGFDGVIIGVVSIGFCSSTFGLSVLTGVVAFVGVFCGFGVATFLGIVGGGFLRGGVVTVANLIVLLLLL
jgi:hypothetical protein